MFSDEKRGSTSSPRASWTTRRRHLHLGPGTGRDQAGRPGRERPARQATTARAYGDVGPTTSSRSLGQRGLQLALPRPRRQRVGNAGMVRLQQVPTFARPNNTGPRPVPATPLHTELSGFDRQLAFAVDTTFFTDKEAANVLPLGAGPDPRGNGPAGTPRAPSRLRARHAARQRHAGPALGSLSAGRLLGSSSSEPQKGSEPPTIRSVEQAGHSPRRGDPSRTTRPRANV